MLHYLDHAASTPVRDVAIEAMLPVLTSDFGNPSGAAAAAVLRSRPITVPASAVEAPCVNTRRRDQPLPDPSWAPLMPGILSGPEGLDQRGNDLLRRQVDSQAHHRFIGARRLQRRELALE